MAQINVAVVQAASVLFDKEACIEKAAQLVKSAAEQGAQLVLLPEAFIPAYPRGFSFGMVVGSRTDEGRALWQRYYDNAIVMGSSDIDQLANIAKENEVYLAIGVVERDAQSSTLYCSILYFSPEGKLMGMHRKLKPTGSERLIWGEGDGSTLPVFDTEIGKFGGLICWENYMPLARMAMYGQGIEIYLAPTADSRDTWQSTLQHIAAEGRCFVLGCNQFVTKDMLPSDIEMLEELDDAPHVMCRGGSVIISPTGKVLAGPLYGEEGILCAILDLDEITRARVDFDVVGHYARPDVFQLKINRNAKTSVSNEPAG